MIDCASVDVDFPSRRWRGIIPNEMRFHDDSADSSQCGWESITQVKSGQFTASSRNGHRRFSTLKFIQKLKDDYKSGPVQQLKNLHTFKLWHNFCWAKSPTTDTQWRQKSKISEKLGRCGRQSMLPPYLKIWEWEWIFGRVVKANASQSVRSPWILQLGTTFFSPIQKK